MEPLKIHLDALEMAGKMVDKHIGADSSFPSLINLMRYNTQGIARHLLFFYRHFLYLLYCAWLIPPHIIELFLFGKK